MKSEEWRACVHVGKNSFPFILEGCQGLLCAGLWEHKYEPGKVQESVQLGRRRVRGEILLAPAGMNVLVTYSEHQLGLVRILATLAIKSFSVFSLQKSKLNSKNYQRGKDSMFWGQGVQFWEGIQRKWGEWDYGGWEGIHQFVKEGRTFWGKTLYKGCPEVVCLISRHL